MDIEFDPVKNEANIAKHGISLADAADFDLASAIIAEDDRFDYGETRYRAFGLHDGQGRCLVFTVIGPGSIRAISYRRARTKELKAHGL